MSYFTSGEDFQTCFFLIVSYLKLNECCSLIEFGFSRKNIDTLLMSLNSWLSYYWFFYITVFGIVQSCSLNLLNRSDTSDFVVLKVMIYWPVEFLSSASCQFPSNILV